MLFTLLLHVLIADVAPKYSVSMSRFNHTKLFWCNLLSKSYRHTNTNSCQYTFSVCTSDDGCDRPQTCVNQDPNACSGSEMCIYVSFTHLKCDLSAECIPMNRCRTFQNKLLAFCDSMVRLSLKIMIQLTKAIVTTATKIHFRAPVQLAVTMLPVRILLHCRRWKYPLHRLSRQEVQFLLRGYVSPFTCWHTYTLPSLCLWLKDERPFYTSSNKTVRCLAI